MISTVPRNEILGKSMIQTLFILVCIAIIFLVFPTFSVSEIKPDGFRVTSANNCSVVSGSHIPNNFADLSRRSSLPFVSGDTFRAFADYLFDETGKSDWDPGSCPKGAIIFVKTDFLSKFCVSKLPFFRRPFILVTHNSDYSAPYDQQNGNFSFLLNHPMVFHWFGQNPSTCDFKFSAIPIGLANRRWPHGDINIAVRARKCLESKSRPRKFKMYLNFNVRTNPRRELLFDYLNSTFHVTVSRPISWESYLHELCQSEYVLSPPGNGLDCHRTWEVLIYIHFLSLCLFYWLFVEPGHHDGFSRDYRIQPNGQPVSRFTSHLCKIYDGNQI
jgi:hypothetical protein